MSELCLAPTRSGRLCERKIRRRGVLDHCCQHGGPRPPHSVVRFAAGESVADIAASFDGAAPLAARVAYVERQIRRWMG